MILRGQICFFLPIAIAGCGQATHVHSELEARERVSQPTEPAGLRREFVSLREAVKAAKTGPDRIAVLQNATERFAGTRYEKTIKLLIEYQRLRATMADPSLSRLHRLRLCQEFFKGTSYEKSIRKLIEKAERRERAEEPRDEAKD